MPLETSFTCPNGHAFTANAKIRARCPSCGTLARKDFAAKSTEAIGKVIAVKEPTLVRSGKATPVKKPIKSKLIAKKPTAPEAPITRTRVPLKTTVRKVAGGTVKVHTAPKGTSLTVKKLPHKTNVSRQAQSAAKQSGQRGTSYAQEMMRRFGIGR